MTKKVLPKVSFIIPTLNAAHILPKCLTAIRSQAYPSTLIEIIIADGGSTDNTKKIAKKFRATIINNPEILHEPGKSLASSRATGDIVFYTDADNILSTPDWLNLMTAPYLEHPEVSGFLPQTIPAPDSNPLDRYLGYICTDPFTWFVYRDAARPEDFSKVYKPISSNDSYSLYRFHSPNIPLFGLSQGVGTHRSFSRSGMAHADDMLAGIKLMDEGRIIAVIPKAGVYHYHIDSFGHFIRKYTWRTRNNLQQKIRGMGLVHRVKFFTAIRKIRMLLFFPYACSILFPIIDSCTLAIRFRSWDMFWHVPATIALAVIMMSEYIRKLFHVDGSIDSYS